MLKSVDSKAGRDIADHRDRIWKLTGRSQVTTYGRSAAVPAVSIPRHATAWRSG